LYDDQSGPMYEGQVEHGAVVTNRTYSAAVVDLRSVRPVSELVTRMAVGPDERRKNRSSPARLVISDEYVPSARTATGGEAGRQHRVSCRARYRRRCGDIRNRQPVLVEGEKPRRSPLVGGFADRVFRERRTDADPDPGSYAWTTTGPKTRASSGSTELLTFCTGNPSDC